MAGKSAKSKRPVAFITGAHVGLGKATALQLARDFIRVNCIAPGRTITGMTTPLMMAAHYGTAKAVKLLLEEGADPRIKNSLGLSALDFALHGDDKLSAEYIQAFLQVWQQRYPEKPVAGE